MTYVYNIGIKLVLWWVGKFYPPTLGKFLHLEEIKDKIFQAAKRKEEQFPDLVTSYISAAFLIPTAIIIRLPWEVTFSLFALASSKYIPTVKIPLLRPHKTKGEKDPWDYEGRLQNLYTHLLAKSYGWDAKDIDNLPIDKALALVQEVITDEQLDREFLWAMSERSYIYDSKTKSGRPNPLERPYFMKEPVKEPTKVKMPVNMLPPGVDYSSVPTEFRPK